MTADRFTPRPANKNDIDEVLRLMNAMPIHHEQDIGIDWFESARKFLETNIESNECRVFVVDSPDQIGILVGCGVGLITQIAPPWLPNERLGYLQFFYTEPSWHGNGIAQTIVSAFIKWFSENDVTRVQLHTTLEAEDLYRKMGFVDTAYTNLWWSRPEAE